MRWSKMFIPTLRETPAGEGCRTLALMARAGYARIEGGEIAAYLPLGQKSIRKIEELVRQRLAEKGGQEFSLRGRYSSKGCAPLGSSAAGEEAISPTSCVLRLTYEDRLLWEIASCHLRSYRELPQLWFYFSSEPLRVSRARFIRSFFVSVAPSRQGDTGFRDPAFETLSGLILDCGLNPTVARGLPTPPQEEAAEEHFALSPHGESQVALCRCGYSASLDCATSRTEPPASGEPSSDQPRLVETPGKKTVAGVAEFLGVPLGSVIKSLLYVVAGKPLLALVRGDDQLNESLLCRAVGSSDARPATEDEVRAIFGAEAGSIGPVGQTPTRILADRALQRRRNLVCGANRDGYHLTGVEPEMHFHAEYFDLRLVRAGDPCPDCGQPISIERARRLMRSSRLRQPLPEIPSPQVLGRDNKPHPLSADAHTFYLDSFLLSLVERFSDRDGMALPQATAPFEVVVTPIDYADETQRIVSDRIYEALRNERVDVLLDDRECSPGVKFKDADLIGVPLRITVGPKKLKEGKVELRSRRTGDCFDCGVEEVVQPAIRRLIP